MMIIYTLDSQGFLAETVQMGDLFAPVPTGVLLAPPTLAGTEVARWVSGTWEILAEYPAPAPATEVVSVPQSVTMRQARLALLAAGLSPGVEAAIAAMPEPDRTAAQITWEFAATVDRGFGMVPQLAAAVGMTEAQIDALFIAAAAL